MNCGPRAVNRQLVDPELSVELALLLPVTLLVDALAKARGEPLTYTRDSRSWITCDLVEEVAQ